MILYRMLLTAHYPKSILRDLNKSLGNLDPSGTKELRKQMSHEGFYGGLIQLNIYARFKKKYNVELEPKVPPKTLDIKLVMDNKSYFFEIYTPKRPKRLDFVRTAHSIDNEKTINKIIKKFSMQLKACANLNSPVILIIDNENKSVDPLDIQDFLKGGLQFRIPFDDKNKESMYAVRNNNSFNDRVKEGNLLSCVILLRREIDGMDLKVKLCGKIYKNPRAKFPIDGTAYEKIKNSLFDTKI